MSQHISASLQGMSVRGSPPSRHQHSQRTYVSASTPVSGATLLEDVVRCSLVEDDNATHIDTNIAMLMMPFTSSQLANGFWHVTDDV